MERENFGIFFWGFFVVLGFGFFMGIVILIFKLLTTSYVLYPNLRITDKNLHKTKTNNPIKQRKQS
jgi:hypothetical protein